MTSKARQKFTSAMRRVETLGVPLSHEIAVQAQQRRDAQARALEEEVLQLEAQRQEHEAKKIQEETARKNEQTMTQEKIIAAVDRLNRMMEGHDKQNAATQDKLRRISKDISQATENVLRSIQPQGPRP